MHTRIFVGIAAIALAAGVSCLNSTDPGRFVFQYALGVYDCGADCTQPGTTPVTSAARGDTVWLRHDIVLLQASDTARRATIRPGCGINAVLESATAAVDTIPTPTCGDSLAQQSFALDATETRYHQWIVDSARAPAVYRIVGRVMVQPRLEPSFFFTVQ